MRKERRADALLNYLSTLPEDYWASEEEIIAALPGVFVAKPRPNATTLDGNIYQAMNLINKRGGVIVVNNNKRCYKIATKTDAKSVQRQYIQKGIRAFTRAANIGKMAKKHGTYNLFTDGFIDVFISDAEKIEKAYNDWVSEYFPVEEH